MDMTKLENKLLMTGSRVICKNSFAIGYIDKTNNIRLIRLGKNGIISDDKPIVEIRMSDFFVIIGRTNNLVNMGMYISGKDTNLMSRAKASRIFFPKGMKTVTSHKIEGSTQILMYITSSNRTVLINNKGKRYDISNLELFSFHGKHLGIVHDEKSNRYGIGYGWPVYGKSGKMVMQEISEPGSLKDYIFTTDPDFEDVRLMK